MEPQTSATRKLAEGVVAVVTRVDHMDEDLVNVGRDMILGFAGLATRIDNRIEMLMGALAGIPPAVLPPMRRREDSVHTIDQTAESVGDKGKTKAQQIVETPGIDLTPEVVGQLIKSEVKDALLAQREADRVKKLESDAAAAEAKRLADAAETERLRLVREADARLDISNKKNARYLTWSGIVVGIVVLLATTAVAFMGGRSVEHDKNFAERLAAPVPVLPVIVSATAAPPLATVPTPALSASASGRRDR